MTRIRFRILRLQALGDHAQLGVCAIQSYPRLEQPYDELDTDVSVVRPLR